MEMLGWLTNSLSSAVASNKKIRKLYAETPTIKNPENPVCSARGKGKLSFSHVSFVREEKPVLSDISFTVEAGHTLGIMGATGSGKSSIVQLIQRMYDCSDGSISLDDVDIRELTLKQVRSSISAVMQDVFLFSDTIDENVRLGKKDSITPDVVREALPPLPPASLSKNWRTVTIPLSANAVWVFPAARSSVSALPVRLPKRTQF